MLTIAFPMVDPVAISLGPFVVRWYALAYIAGLLLGWRYCRYLAAKGGPVSPLPEQPHPPFRRVPPEP